MTKNNKNIVIEPYNPQWSWIYEGEARSIQKALGEHCLAIHHFGSTSVSGLSAKPKIDILVVTKDFSSIDTAALKRLGFEYRGEVIPSGRYFTKKEPKVHLHLFEEGNPLIERNLLFRDWLRNHEEDRKAYAKLKQELANKHTDGMEYCRAKTEFIEKIILKSLKGFDDGRL